MRSISFTTKIVYFLSACALTFGFFVLADNSSLSDVPQVESTFFVKQAVASEPFVVEQHKPAISKSHEVINKAVFAIKGDDGVVEFTDQQPVDSDREFTTKLLNQKIRNVVPAYKAPLVKNSSVSVIKNNVVSKNNVNSSNVSGNNKETMCKNYQDRLGWLRSRMRAGYHHSKSNRLHEQERLFKEKIDEYCR